MVAFVAHSNTDFCTVDKYAALVALSQFPAFVATIHAHSVHIYSPIIVLLPYLQVYGE